MEGVPLICQGTNGPETLLRSQPHSSSILGLNSGRERRKKKTKTSQKSLKTFPQSNFCNQSVSCSPVLGVKRKMHIQKMPYLLSA